MFSDNDIVPESYQMRLMAWRDEFTRGYFEIGDIANEIVLLNLQKGMQIEHASIHSAVGRFCGKSGRTIRDYAEVAAFFPENIRSEYDMLPFSHFRFAKTCGRKWEDVLDYSAEHPDASEEKLAHEFSVASQDLSVAASNLDVAAQSFYVASKELDVAAPTVAASVAVRLPGIFALSNLISQAESMLTWKMKDSTKNKLVVGLTSLKDALSDLTENESAFKFDYDTQEAPPYMDIP